MNKKTAEMIIAGTMLAFDAKLASDAKHASGAKLATGAKLASGAMLATGAKLAAGAMLASMASALSEYADEKTGETLASSSTAVMTEETEETTDSKDTNRAAASEEDAEAKKEKMRALYGENKQITDDNYDKSLAVKCINGTFVGKRTDNIIAYKGIPFVGEQPVGKYRWKAPVEFTADDGVYEAYYYSPN